MSLDSLVDALHRDELKFLFVGGKGGVGKTTSSSAIAYLLASSSSSSSSSVSNNNSNSSKRILLVSTDPAHSLGDAWRMTFSNKPIKVLPNLDVIELDPKETMTTELDSWMKYAKEFGSGGDDVESFHSWISGIPGIDEATALSSAITHIESGNYDLIIFDTAPTGHTLKLLALPEILDKGISKLQSWQGTVWTYLQAFKGVGNNNSKVNMREEMAKKLQSYKDSIQKVATMIQDNTKTRFVVICIAEYLSVLETRRLLQELKLHNVKTSHIIVNQLVVDDALSVTELTQLEQLAEVGNLRLDTNLMKKTIHACRLTTARKTIQQKYLNLLKNFDETKKEISLMTDDGSDGSGSSGGGVVVVEVPLLAEEVTGSEALGRFANLLVTYKVDRDDKNREANKTDTSGTDYHVGNYVEIIGLEKSPHLNGMHGIIISDRDETNGRYGVSITTGSDSDDGRKSKNIALQSNNILKLNKPVSNAIATKNISENSHDTSRKRQRITPTTATASTTTLSFAPSSFNGDDNINMRTTVVSAAAAAAAPSTENTMSKAMTILEDPEIKAMIEENPKVKDAVEDVIENPMNFMKYLSDPELSPFLAKAMRKLKS